MMGRWITMKMQTAITPTSQNYNHIYIITSKNTGYDDMLRAVVSHKMRMLRTRAWRTVS